MILARRGKGEQAAAGARNCHQRGVENGGTQNQYRREKIGERSGVFDAKFQRQRGHQKSQEHGSAIAHENLGGLKIPAKKSGGGAKDRGSQRGNQSLTA